MQIEEFLSYPQYFRLKITFTCEKGIKYNSLYIICIIPIPFLISVVQVPLNSCVKLYWGQNQSKKNGIKVGVKTEAGTRKCGRGCNCKANKLAALIKEEAWQECVCVGWCWCWKVSCNRTSLTKVLTYFRNPKVYYKCDLIVGERCVALLRRLSPKPFLAKGFSNPPPSTNTGTITLTLTLTPLT